MKVKIEYTDGTVTEFKNVNYIAEDGKWHEGKFKELIGICFIDENEEDKDIYKEDIKSISTYEEYENGVESWRNEGD